MNLFLGGAAPTVYGSFNVVLKVSFIVVLIVFIRAVLPRVRVQSMFYMTWIYLIPLFTGLFLLYVFLLIITRSIPVSLLINFNKLC